MNFIYVGLGGALGAMLRYAISMLPSKGEFPIWTLVTNVLGAVLIGAIVQVAAQRSVSPNTILFLKTGLCGGFTTFSTFSLEAYTLYQNHMLGKAGIYVALSLILCLLGVYVGMAIVTLIKGMQ